MINAITILRRYLGLICCLGIFVLIFATLAAAKTENRHGYFDALKKRLIQDGFNKNKINTLYAKPQVYFETKGVSRFLVHREAELNYDQFASPDNIERALQYLETHRSTLEQAQQAFGVEKEIITAIILVETQLGTSLGRPSVLNMLSSMASLSDPVVQDMFWKKTSGANRFSRKNFETWARRKAKWAYSELKAFLKYAAREKMNPVTIYGSYAGAMGIAQFMPSSVLAFGRDGNKDGRVDLFDHADAIVSIANYLKHFGWHDNINKKNAQKVIFHYNRSTYYVDTVLKISELLKG